MKKSFALLAGVGFVLALVASYLYLRRNDLPGLHSARVQEWLSHPHDSLHE